MGEEKKPEICDASIHQFPERSERTGEFWDMASDLNPEMVVFDGPEETNLFDNCIIGIGERIGQPAVLVYEEERMIETLYKSGWSYEETIEWLYINTFGMYVGEGTPIILKMAEMAPFFQTGGGTIRPSI